jgi:hypothetical protein
MKDNERNETFSDLEIKVPMRTDPKKEIHTGVFMTDNSGRLFPTGESPTNKPFVGSQGTTTLEEWMQGKKAVKHPEAKDMQMI